MHLENYARKRAIQKHLISKNAFFGTCIHEKQRISPQVGFRKSCKKMFAWVLFSSMAILKFLSV
jgi:hypothetical protein